MSYNSRRQSDFFDVCRGCSAECCRKTDPPITTRRRKIIEEYLKNNEISIKEPFLQTQYVFPKVNTDGYCIFYDKKTKKCQIHSVKPETCIAGPVTFDINEKTQKIEWYLKTENICQLAGKMNKNRNVLQKHLKSVKKEILRLIRELDTEALKVILRIEESQTFKIDEDNLKKDRSAKLDST